MSKPTDNQDLARKLTRRQEDVFTFIGEHLDRRGHAPTIAEIAEALDLGSPSGAHRIVAALEKRGLVSREPGRSRSIRLSTASPPHIEPGSAEAILVNFVVQNQSAARDRCLRMAAAAQETDVKTALIRDAAARNDLVALQNIPDPETVALPTLPIGALLQELGRDTGWTEFVVDHYVFNETTLDPLDVLRKRYPSLERPLLAVRRIGRRAVDDASLWLKVIGENASPNELDDLERRAMVTRQLCDVSARLVEEQVAGSLQFPARSSENPIRLLLGRARTDQVTCDPMKRAARANASSASGMFPAAT